MLLAILVGAALLRAWGIGSDLPYIYHPDEPSYITISQQIYKSGDLNPHWFHFSSLLFYLNALAYWPFEVVGKLLGALHATGDILAPELQAMGTTRAPMPAVVLLGRSVSLLFGLATVALAFAVGRLWRGDVRVGLLAAGLVAVAPTAAKYSRLVVPDALVCFWVLATLWCALRVLRDGRLRDYVLTGLCVGLAASSKYNGALAGVWLLAAHALRGAPLATATATPATLAARAPSRGWWHWLDHRLATGLACCALGFIVATPYSLLDTRNFLDGVAFEFNHYSTGHPGMEGHAFAWYLGHLAITGGALLPLAAYAAWRGWRERRADTLLVAAFPIAYLAFVSLFAVRNDRTILPALPALAILAAGSAVTLAVRWRAVPPVAVLALLLLAPPLAASLHDGLAMARIDNRELARRWIDGNLPAGSRVAIESYAPFVDPARYRVQSFGRLIEHDAAWYRAQGFDAMVFSQGMYGCFLADPARYPAEDAAYRAMFGSLPGTRLFADPEHEVRVAPLAR